MEIYRQRINTIYFEAPSETDVVSASLSLSADATPYPVTVSGNGAGTRIRSAQVPYISDEGTLTVEWSWAGGVLSPTGYESTAVNTQIDTYEVVSPILTDTEIRVIHPQATDSEVIRIEKAVRHIINSHTGQRFGRFVGEFSVKGNGGSLLQLPGRLLSLTSVDGISPVDRFIVENDGWALRYYPWGVPPVKADAYGLHMHVGGVIHNPNNIKLGTFDAARSYKVAGAWGWDEVPSAVAEAAKLLVNDYACSDAQYRDRYLTSMTAADWRIQFNSGAFNQTGNVRADQLLSDYVLRRGWAVL